MSSYGYSKPIDRMCDMNINRKQIILFALLSLLVTGFIFHNSMQTIEHSRAQSNALIQVLKPILDPKGKCPEDIFSKIVRKTAHLVEFAALGACLHGLVDGIRRRFWKSAHLFFPLFAILCVAVADELIQSFTGRGSMVSDVVLDFAGGVFGMIAAGVLISMMRKLFRTALYEKS